MGGRTGIVKKKQAKKKTKGSGLYGEWLDVDEHRTGEKKARRAKRSMKDLRGFKSGPKKKITHSRMIKSKKKGDKMNQWEKYYQ